ncbi:MAG TPA: peptidoglycan DD-metalloendopeptidase family protein [Candidatus Paceibacterota bacterium]
MQVTHRKFFVFLFLFSLAIFFAVFSVSFFTSHFVFAETVDELRQKISDNNKKIEDLQNQIEQYSNLLNSTSKEAKTLKSALSALEITQKKLEASLSLITTQISKTKLTLTELNGDISTAEKQIEKNLSAISENIKTTNMTESQSIIEELLGGKNLSDSWNYVNALHTIQSRMKIDLENLRDLRATLAVKRDQAVGEKTKLETYQKNLSDQKKVVVNTKQEKDKLLRDTQNKESNYKAILAGKIQQKEVFEKELFAYESKLKIAIDPAAIPGARAGVLSWPLDKISVTQYFGKTISARRLYVSGTHNGIDFRASIGTPIKTALSGTVTDTEAIRVKSGCQYGKFVLIKHPNGLSTIYGHLSVVSVQPGDTVITGDIIGYSGDTGYATGPHLHFGLYVTQGIRIVDSSSLGSSRCTGIKTIAAPPAAYLDPSAYLPKS